MSNVVENVLFFLFFLQFHKDQGDIFKLCVSSNQQS